MSESPASECGLTEPAGSLSPAQEAVLASPVEEVKKYHDDSDTRIVVQSNGTQKIYEVCSGPFAAASRVWRSMLYGEVRNTDDVVLVLDGDARAIDYLLSIVHYRFNAVPTGMPIDWLYHMALATSQYECTHLVSPWVNRWLEPYDHFDTDQDCYLECHKLVWIAWEFGKLDMFKHMTDALVVSCKVNAAGDLENVRGQVLKDMTLPVGLLDFIVSTRSATITAILGAVQTTGIKTLAFVGHDWAPHKDHRHCSTGLNQTVIKILHEMPEVVANDKYMEHLSEKSEQSGCDPGAEILLYRKEALKQSANDSTESGRHSPCMEEMEDNSDEENGVMATDGSESGAGVADGTDAVNGHQNDGHQNDGHQSDGHQNDGHQNDGHQSDGHQNDGHQNDGHQNDGHQNDGHQNVTVTSDPAQDVANDVVDGDSDDKVDA
ncbi:hypothetical protein GGR56DRAFT_691472 [Xylariaceae sp. FL0804]|nr:hypothetical protein GGR56DRAFT_691472 [Xylariaceae sp. FL0804]